MRRTTGWTVVALAAAAVSAPGALAGAPQVTEFRYTEVLGLLNDPCAGVCGPGVTIDRQDPSFAALAARLPATLPPSRRGPAIPDAGSNTLLLTLADGSERRYSNGYPDPLARVVGVIRHLLPSDLHEQRLARRQVTLRPGGSLLVEASTIIQRPRIGRADLVLTTRRVRANGLPGARIARVVTDTRRRGTASLQALTARVTASGRRAVVVVTWADTAGVAQARYTVSATAITPAG